MRGLRSLLARVDERNRGVSRAFRSPVSNAASLGWLGATPGRKATATAPRTGGPRRRVRRSATKAKAAGDGLVEAPDAPLPRVQRLRRGVLWSLRRSRGTLPFAVPVQPRACGEQWMVGGNAREEFGSAPRPAVHRSVLCRVSGWAQLPNLGVTVRTPIAPSSGPGPCGPSCPGLAGTGETGGPNR
jgi:hypothetical protein